MITACVDTQDFTPTHDVNLVGKDSTRMMTVSNWLQHGGIEIL